MKKLFKTMLFIVLTITFSCDNESVGEADPVNEDELIQVASDLYRTLEFISEDEPENVAACLEFVYNFSIIVYAQTSK